MKGKFYSVSFCYIFFLSLGNVSFSSRMQWISKENGTELRECICNICKRGTDPDSSPPPKPLLKPPIPSLKFHERIVFDLVFQNLRAGRFFWNLLIWVREGSDDDLKVLSALNSLFSHWPQLLQPLLLLILVHFKHAKPTFGQSLYSCSFCMEHSWHSHRIYFLTLL